jgi:3-phosphoshikimate 1-carboxyvinyltransferase
LPAVIFGGSSRRESAHSSSEKDQSRLTSAATISIAESSQFASALLLCARHGGWEVKVIGENAEESPYVAMTSKMIEAFPKSGGKFQIEPDASSGSYFLGAKLLLNKEELRPAIVANAEESFQRKRGIKAQAMDCSYPPTLSEITVWNWPKSAWQMDSAFQKHLFPKLKDWIEAFFYFPTELSRVSDLGDSIMTAIVISSLMASRRVRFAELGRLRVQECERVMALQTELTKCGVKVIEEGDTLVVYPRQLPSKPHGAEIETYNDHRMAMCFAILGLKVPGIKIKNPACVKKTFPNFFQKLAAPPPHGLGATILDAKTGRKLELKELFAD